MKLARSHIVWRISLMSLILIIVLVTAIFLGLSFHFWFADQEAANEETIAFAVGLIVLAVSMVLGTFLSWWMSTSITKPIHQCDPGSGFL